VLRETIRPVWRSPCQRSSLRETYPDTVIWLVLGIMARAIAEIVASVLPDQALIKHDQAEAGAECELPMIYARGQERPAWFV